MQTMFEAYLAGMALTARARELLCKALEGRAIALRECERPGSRPARWAIRELFERWGHGERLGRRLGREIYGCYSELLELGLPQDRALELTKSLIEGLARRSRSRLGLS